MRCELNKSTIHRHFSNLNPFTRFGWNVQNLVINMHTELWLENKKEYSENLAIDRRIILTPQASNSSVHLSVFKLYYQRQPECALTDCRLTRYVIALPSPRRIKLAEAYLQRCNFLCICWIFSSEELHEICGMFHDLWTSCLVVSKWCILVHHVAWKQVIYWKFWNSLVMKKYVSMREELK
jgi:hypothetical protein